MKYERERWLVYPEKDTLNIFVKFTNGIVGKHRLVNEEPRFRVTIHSQDTHRNDDPVSKDHHGSRESSWKNGSCCFDDLERLTTFWPESLSGTERNSFYWKSY